ncbi:hypothetical protein AMECASPLE_027955 [Ameca splendens]|uniref:Uncharacterized protein n=1 Tax=Ameca splendens TaxID=208324 RepID=A0ABV0Z396_9TELE
MLFVMPRFIYNRCEWGRKRAAEVTEGKWSLLFCVEAANDTLMNLGDRRSPSESHTTAPTQFMSLFIVPHFFTFLFSVSAHRVPSTHTYTSSPYVVSSSSLWPELSHTH